MELEIKLILYILLGAVAGMLYSLKRVIRMERLILEMDKKISKKLGVKPTGEATVKVKGKRVTKKVKKTKRRRKRK